MIRFPVTVVSVLVCSLNVASAQPQYNIIDLGIISGDTYSQAHAISSNGQFVAGRSVTSFNASHAISWTQAGGLVTLPNLTSPARPCGVGLGVNNTGVVVGFGGNDVQGANAVPLMWQSGSVSQLPLPSGASAGEATAINNPGVAVGLVAVGPNQLAVRWSGGTPTYISQQTSNGSYLIQPTAINDSGRIVGQGIDPNNSTLDVGYVYDISTNTAFSVGALPGMNGALNYGVSNAGHIVGGSNSNGGNAVPFIWTQAGGMHAIPLLPGTFMGAGYAVNSAGWVVGTMSGNTAVPFLYDGTSSYALANLIPSGSGWNLLTTITAEAHGVSESGIIVGAGEYNGQTHAFAMIPVPEPSTLLLVGVAGGLAAWRRNRRVAS